MSIPNPRSVRVGVFEYSVELDSAEEIDGNCGSTRNELERIRISPVLSPGQGRSTLLHEVLHACLHFAGMRGEEEKLTEEEFVTRLAPVLLMVLVDNPELVYVLTEED